ncbi:MAG: hypothetical protein LUQ29_11500 [Methylococcaceae bacterium]|jgi:hypothetical protein|nr:hypothetical protein [Methylococcaceae bacterium]
MIKRILLKMAQTFTIAAITMAGSVTGAFAAPEYKYSTPMPSGVALPDKVEMRLGTLNFLDIFILKPCKLAPI